MTDLRPTRRTRWGAAAGLLGATTAFVAIAGAGPAPSLLQLASSREDVSGNCDEAEHADDLACAGAATGGTTSTTVDGGSTTTVGGPGSTTPADEIRTIDANGAGLVIVAVEGGSLRLVAATPSTGWSVEIEQSAGREIEVDFRFGSKRVQVNVELEDGEVRERVRTRDDAASGGSPTTIGDNPDDDESTDDDDHSGPGHDGSDDEVDDDSDDDDSDDEVDDDSDDDSDDDDSDDEADEDSDDDKSGSGHGGDD